MHNFHWYFFISVVMDTNSANRFQELVMPPTLKKLMGHIAFGACDGACVGGCVGHTFCTYCNFSTVKARVLKFHMWIPHKK